MARGSKNFVGRRKKHTFRRKSHPVKGVLPPGNWHGCRCCYHSGTSTRGLLKAELRREIQEMSQ